MLRWPTGTETCAFGGEPMLQVSSLGRGLESTGCESGPKTRDGRRTWCASSMGHHGTSTKAGNQANRRHGDLHTLMVQNSFDHTIDGGLAGH